MYEEKANIEMRRYADGTRNNQAWSCRADEDYFCFGLIILR